MPTLIIIVIADRCFLFKNPLHGEWKTKLFNYLYKQSLGYYNSEKKGYDYGVDGLWQGTYNTYLVAIGNKCGGTTTGQYRKSKVKFLEYCEELKKKLQIATCYTCCKKSF